MNKLGICLSFLFQFTLILAFKSQGLLFTWKEESEPFDSKSEPVGILKNAPKLTDLKKMSRSGDSKPRPRSSDSPACPFGPCETPQCCDTGIAVKMGQSPFTENKCYHRGCYSCLSQKYLLGIQERCSLDQSVMKSLCSPGMSCMIYCSEKAYGMEHCWQKYGTCQLNMATKLIESKYPGNVTVIPGLKKRDAKRYALCTREHTMCKCKGRKCDSRSSGEKSWCFISYVRNPANPTQNCYSDVRWSDTYGSFYSHEACKKLEGKEQEDAPVEQDDAPVEQEDATVLLNNEDQPTTRPWEPAPETNTVPVQEPGNTVPVPEPETVHPLKDEPTTAMPAEALDTSTNPPLEQEDAPVEQEDAPVEQDDAPVEQEDGRIDASELVNNEDEVDKAPDASEFEQNDGRIDSGEFEQNDGRIDPSEFEQNDGRIDSSEFEQNDGRIDASEFEQNDGRIDASELLK